MRRAGLWMTLLLATVVHAQSSKPMLVGAPLEVDPHPSLLKVEKDVVAAFNDALEKRSGALVPSVQETWRAVEELPGREFASSDEALALLAKKTGTLYALHASLQYTVRKMVVLTGRVVRDDGKLMGNATVQLPRGNGTFVALMPALADAFFAQLAITSLPSSRDVKVVEAPVVQTAPVVTPVPVVAPPPAVYVDAGLGQRSAGRAVFISGLGVAVVGGVLVGVSQALGSGLGIHDGLLPPSRQQDFRTAQTLSTAGFVTLGVGGLAAVIGAIVWGSAPSVPVQVALQPTRDGFAFSLSGAL